MDMGYKLVRVLKIKNVAIWSSVSQHFRRPAQY